MSNLSSEASSEIKEKLYENLKNGNLYDSINHPIFGTYALIIYDKIPYIVEIKNGSLNYKAYPNNHAAKKAWDHVCNKFEKWYTNRHG